MVVVDPDEVTGSTKGMGVVTRSHVACYFNIMSGVAVGPTSVAPASMPGSRDMSATVPPASTGVATG